MGPPCSCQHPGYTGKTSPQFVGAGTRALARSTGWSGSGTGSGPHPPTRGYAWQSSRRRRPPPLLRSLDAPPPAAWASNQRSGGLETHPNPLPRPRITGFLGSLRKLTNSLQFVSFRRLSSSVFNRENHVGGRRETREGRWSAAAVLLGSDKKCSRSGPASSKSRAALYLQGPTPTRLFFFLLHERAELFFFL